MANQTPDTGINYEVYDADGKSFIGVAQVDLPAVSAMTAEVKGAGISGTIDVPVIGHTQAMSMTLNFRTPTEQGYKLLKARHHHLECWAAIQITDPDSGQYVVKQHKVIVRGPSKVLTPGKLTVAETHDRTIEIEVVYYKEELDGKEKVEIDKYNMIHRIEGEDQLEEVRAAIGL
jgi:P2 family phage contractile tail tube protein